jgi:hypothetical protein
MRLTEAQLRSTIRKLLAEWTAALKADAEWEDLTDGSGPMKGLLSGKTVAQAIKDLYSHLSELEMDELKDQFPEVDADIISSGDEAEALDHLRVVVTAIHAENEKDYARDTVRQDLMYFATKSKMPELRDLQKRVLDPREPEFTIDSLAYEKALKAILEPLEDQVESLSDEEAKRLRNIFSAEEDEERSSFMRPKSKYDPKGDPDAATVPGIKSEAKMRITVGQLKALVREAAKRRPSGWLPATEKNLDLDKPFTADSWITNQTGVPVNVLVRNYLKSMGMLEEEDE